MTIQVEPTAPAPTKQYSDIALTGLFNAHLSVLNSERHVIWLRYQSMLLANSIILGFVAQGQRGRVVGSIIGLLLCFAWLVISVSGWRLTFRLNDAASGFAWQSLGASANPLETYREYRLHDWIFWGAIGVIVLFMVAHAWAILR